MRSQSTKSRHTGALRACLAAGALVPFAAQSTTPPDANVLPGWELVIGPMAYHWSNEETHSHVVLLGLERTWTDDAMAGLSVFRNSFGQPSAYAYYGHTWNDVFGARNLYVKLSGGIIYGYKGRYEDKVPFNHNGFGLGIIPAVGYRLTPSDAVQVGILGSAALIFTYSRRF